MANAVDTPRAAAIVLAAGRGTRFSARENKVFIPLLRRPLICHSLQAFQDHPFIDTIVLVAARDRLDFCRRLVRTHKFTKVAHVVAGGECREESVFNGLSAHPFHAGQIVLVHDGARPVLSGRLITDILRAAARHGAAVPGLVPKCTIKAVSADGLVCGTPERKTLREIQTPQGFHFTKLYSAVAQLRDRLEAFTDDASIVEAAGHRVAVVEGEETNLKVTTQNDLALAKLFLCPAAAGRKKKT